MHRRSHVVVLGALALTLAAATRPARAETTPPTPVALAPTPPPAPDPDPSVSQTEPVEQPLVVERERPAWHRPTAMGALLGVNGAVYAWTYFAWYRGRATLDHVVIAKDGWFGPHTYAGGADKLGHGYANYMFSRTQMSILEAAGWDRTVAAVTSGALTALMFTVIEIKDGVHEGYGFSIGDQVFNLGGNALGILFAMEPRLDEMFDLRIGYVPTDEFIEEVKANGVNVAEDYSGMNFDVVYHLGSLDAIRSSGRRTRWLQYVDVQLGYETRGYLPVPADPMTPREQRMFIGVSLNVQGLLRDFAYGKPDKEISWRAFADGFLEYYTLPLTTLRVADTDRARPPLMDTP